MALKLFFENNYKLEMKLLIKITRKNKLIVEKNSSLLDILIK